jgi:hypothetical protein
MVEPVTIVGLISGKGGIRIVDVHADLGGWHFPFWLVVLNQGSATTYWHW